MERDGNADMCCLCNQGGSLLCCDRCPASYHMRCIGEQAKSLPEGEWACPECAVGSRGKSAFTFRGTSTICLRMSAEVIVQLVDPCFHDDRLWTTFAQQSGWLSGTIQVQHWDS